MNRRLRIIVLVCAAAVIVGVGGWWAYRDYQQRRAIALFKALLSAPAANISWRGDLPPAATDIHEWAWADGFLPDYSYMLKARITPPEFQQFVIRLGLTPHTPDRIYSEEPWLSWSAGPGFTGDWWDASDTYDSTFVKEGHNTWTFAKYENGFLYFESLNH